MQEQSKINAKPLTQPPGLLFEMIRSFVTLSQTLNLSRAVEQLGSTRQTVRRHISQLEEMMGCALFVVEDRRYVPTAQAQEALPMAERILTLGVLWLDGNLRDVDGLQQLFYGSKGTWQFHQSQQPLSHIWEGNSRMLKAAIRAWADGEAALESDHMQKVRPYLLVYRETDTGWICAEIGEKSFYSNWWGWKTARSSVGRSLDNFPGGKEFSSILQDALREVRQTRGLRLDQVVTQMPREEGGALTYIAFDRLLMGSRYPDGSFALIVAVDRAEKIVVPGLDPTLLLQVPADTMIDF